MVDLIAIPVANAGDDLTGSVSLPDITLPFSNQDAVSLGMSLDVEYNFYRLSLPAPLTVTDASAAASVGQVMNLVVVPGDGQNTLSWDQVVSDPPVTEYEIEANFGSGFVLTDLEPGVSASITHLGLTNNEPVTYRVRAYDGSTFGPYSEEVTGEPQESSDVAITSDGQEITIVNWDGSEVTLMVDDATYQFSVNPSNLGNGPINVLPPSISGDTNEFGVLQTGVGIWIYDEAYGEPNLEISWFVDGEVIPDEDADTLDPAPSGVVSSRITATQSGLAPTSVDSNFVTVNPWLLTDDTDALAIATFDNINQFKTVGGVQAAIGDEVHEVVNEVTGQPNFSLVAGRTPGTLGQAPDGRYYIRMADAVTNTPFNSCYSTGTSVPGDNVQIDLVLAASENGQVFSLEFERGIYAQRGSTGYGIVSQTGATPGLIIGGTPVSDYTRGSLADAILFDTGTVTDSENRRLVQMSGYNVEANNGNLSFGQRPNPNGHAVNDLSVYGVLFRNSATDENITFRQNAWRNRHPHILA